jgi:hypothetical protein
MEAKLNEQTASVRTGSNARAGETTTAVVAGQGALGDVRLLLVGLWLGSAIFFSFAVAPSAFAVLPARELAGAIVTRTIAIVNVGGLLIGLLLLTTVFAGRDTGVMKRARMAEAIALALVVLATGIGHWVISARMAALRLSMGRPIDEVAQNDPLRLTFNSLHGYSVAAMSIAILASFVAFILIARRNRNA